MVPSALLAQWLPWVRDADVLLVDGGDASDLGYWLRQSGLPCRFDRVHQQRPLFPR